MQAIAKESFISCLTEGKSYNVLSVDSQYILIEENSGRVVWNWIGLFLIIGKLEETSNQKMKNNYNFI